MAYPRRTLPSLSLLSALEAVCRTGSTLAAARDLDLTQGAVSRLIQNLENQLGVDLFVRDRRRLVPTEGALAYARDVRKALDLISRGAVRLRSNAGGGGTLSLSILPTFGTRWLAPRLPGFMAAHPGITVNLGTRVRPFDFASEGFDAALHYGVENWPGSSEYQKLFDERMMACCAPDFLVRNQIEQPADLMRLPLLQLETRPHAWSTWFARKGVVARAPQGMFFDQFAPMMQSAIYGLGVALLPMFLARPELAEGRLVAAWGPPEPGDGSYYLVWPQTNSGYLPLIAFREWLLIELARDPPDGEEPDILPR